MVAANALGAESECRSLIGCLTAAAGDSPRLDGLCIAYRRYRSTPKFVR
jgi:hypothetical protein